MNAQISRLTATIIEHRETPGVEIYISELLTALQTLEAKPVRYALVTAEAGKQSQLAAYMPENYEIVGRTAIGGTNTVKFLIAGRDSCGWTLDGYVIPRLASGMYFAEEIA